MVNADLDDATLFCFRQEPGHRGACDAECLADLLLVETAVVVQIRDKRNPRWPNIVVVDDGGAVIEGSRRSSVDTEALLYSYRSLPQVNAILHTQQTRATAIGDPPELTDEQTAEAVAVFRDYGFVGLGDFPWAASANTAMLTVVMVDVWIFTPFVLPRVVRHLAPRLRHRDDARRRRNPPADVAGARPVARGPKASGVARRERVHTLAPRSAFRHSTLHGGTPTGHPLSRPVRFEGQRGDECRERYRRTRAVKVLKSLPVVGAARSS